MKGETLFNNWWHMYFKISFAMTFLKIPLRTVKHLLCLMYWNDTVDLVFDRISSSDASLGKPDPWRDAGTKRVTVPNGLLRHVASIYICCPKCKCCSEIQWYHEGRWLWSFVVYYPVVCVPSIFCMSLFPISDYNLCCLWLSFLNCFVIMTKSIIITARMEVYIESHIQWQASFPE